MPTRRRHLTSQRERGCYESDAADADRLRTGIDTRERPCRGAGVSGRRSRPRERRRWRGSRRGSGPVERSDHRRTIDDEQRSGRVQLSQPRARHLYAEGQPPGIQGLRLARRPRRHAAVPHPRRDARSRYARGNGHGSRRHAGHRDVDGVHRHGDRFAGAADAAVAGPRGVPHRHDRADGHPVGRHAVQPPAGSDQRLADLARRRHPPRQQLHARRRADHRPSQPRQRQSVDRVAGGRQGAGAHLRRGDGPDRRRRVQHHAQVGRQRAARHRLRPDPAALGPDEQLFQREGRTSQAEQSLLPRRRRGRRRHRAQPHVLLVRVGELSRRPDAQRQRDDADQPRAPGQLLPDDERGGTAGGHLRSDDRAAIRRKHHPVLAAEQRGPGDDEVPADARRGAIERQRQLHAHLAHQQQVPAAVQREGRPQVQRCGHAQRLLSLQPHRRAGCELFRHRDADRADAVRRSERLHPGAPPADPRAQQHLGDERQLGARAALRHDAVSGQQHAQHRLRSGGARVLAGVSRSDHAGEVSRRARPRLRPVRQPDARRHQPGAGELEVDQRQRQLFEDAREPPVSRRRRHPQDGRRHLHPRRWRRVLRFRQGHDIVQRRHRQHDRRQCLCLVPARLSVDGPNQPDFRLDAAQPVHLLLRRLRAGRLARELTPVAELRPALRARRRPA